MGTTSALVMLLLINQVRTPSHQLMLDKELSIRAQHRAEQMCEANQFSHAGFWTNWVGIKYEYAGENLAKGFQTPQAAEIAFMASPTHRANIVKPQYQVLGVGESCGIIVQLFVGY